MFAQQRQHGKKIANIAAGLLAVFPVMSHAVLTDNFGIGNAKAISLAHAVTADPPGIDSIHFNPAGLTKLKGRQRHLKVLTGDFSIELKLGEYNDEQQEVIDLARQRYFHPDPSLGAQFPTDRGIMKVDEETYFYDESYNTVSETNGATMIMPIFGVQDLPVLLFPIGGASYSAPESNVTFATNVYTPMAMGFNRADDDPGRFIGQRFTLMMLSYFSPSVAVQVTDEFSFGATISFNYAGVGVEMPFREPTPMIFGIPELQAGAGCGTDNVAIPMCNPALLPYDVIGTLTFAVENPLTFGYNIGFLWEPMPWLSLGFVYQSPIAMDLEGDFQWKNEPGWVNFIGGLLEDPAAGLALASLGISGRTLTEGTAYLDMEMPEHYSFGISLQLTPNFKVNMDYKFTAWSVWAGLPVEFSTPIDLLALAEIIQPELATRQSLVFPFGLEDSWNMAVGFEYRYSDRLDLRFGLEDRPSSIPDEAKSPLLPMGDGIFYGAGFGYKLDSGAQLDLGVSYFHSEVDMPGGSSRLGNSNDMSLVIYNPFVGQDIESTLDIILVELSFSQEF